MLTVTPCLWFDDNAHEAVDFYISVFPNSKRLTKDSKNREEKGVERNSILVDFELNGRPFKALNGGPTFQLSPAISLSVDCKDQEEVDHYWFSLLEGGTESQCGWLTDKFGLSWQIVPARLGELMSDSDPELTGRVMAAMLKMIKLDIAGLEQAALGE